MEKRMKYSLYKAGYSEFPAKDYDKKSKSILVILPEYDRPKFPKDWEKVGNWYATPNGSRVYFWNSGLSENFQVEYKGSNKTFAAGLYSRQNVIDYVNSL